MLRETMAGTDWGFAQGPLGQARAKKHHVAKLRSLAKGANAEREL